MTTESKTVQPPSVGRAVHYTPDGYPEGVYLACVIAHVHDDGRVNLGGWDALGAPLSPTPRGIEQTTAPAGSREAVGRWSWPAFVPPKAAEASK